MDADGVAWQEIDLRVSRANRRSCRWASEAGQGTAMNIEVPRHQHQGAPTARHPEETWRSN
jgi:hypothetical protein